MSTSLSFAWDKVQTYLQARIPNEGYGVWLARLHARDLQGTRLVVCAPNAYVKNWVEGHYARELLAAARTVQPEITALEFVVENGRGGAPAGSVPIAKILSDSAAPPSAAPHAAPPPPSLPCRPPSGNTLDTFVAGPANLVAHSACRAVAEMTADYNPLLLFGDHGMGKTHLLEGLAAALREKRPGQRVLLVSAEEFTNAFFQALQDRRLEPFRNEFRRCQVLLMDGVQFFGGKEKTQEEFLFTFEALLSAGRQIVLTCDVHPRDIKRLEPRLAARFQSGLVARLAPPDFALRAELLRRKARLRNLPLDDSLVEMLALRVERSGRELGGAVCKLAALSQAEQRPPDKEMVQHALQELGYVRMGPLGFDEILAAIAQFHNQEVDAVRSERRQANLVRARHLGMYLTKQLTSYTLSEIGRYYGNRDHATVIHACRKIEQELKADESLRAEVAMLRRILGR